MNADGRIVFLPDEISTLVGSRRGSAWWRLSVPLLDAVEPFVVVDPLHPPADPVRIVLPPTGFIEVVRPSMPAPTAALELSDLFRVIVLGTTDRMPDVRRRDFRFRDNLANCCDERRSDERSGRITLASTFDPGRARVRVAPGGVYGIRDTSVFVHSGVDRTHFVRGPRAPGEVVRFELPPGVSPSAAGVRSCEGLRGPGGDSPFRGDVQSFDLRLLDLPAEAVDLTDNPLAFAGAAPLGRDALAGTFARYRFEPVLFRRLSPGSYRVCVRYGEPTAAGARLPDAQGYAYSSAIETTAIVADDGRLELGEPRFPTSRPAMSSPETMAAVRTYRDWLPRRGFAAECRSYFCLSEPTTGGRELTVLAADGLPTELSTLWFRDTTNAAWAERLPDRRGVVRVPSPFASGSVIVTSPSHEGVVLHEFPADGVLRLRPRRVSRVTVRLDSEVVLPEAPRALAVRLDYAGTKDAATLGTDRTHPYSRQLGGGKRFGADRTASWFVREPGRYVVRLFLIDPIDGMYDVPPSTEPVTVATAVVEAEASEVEVVAMFPD